MLKPASLSFDSLSLLCCSLRALRGEARLFILGPVALKGKREMAA